jgi:hypothetical protein
MQLDQEGLEQQGHKGQQEQLGLLVSKAQRVLLVLLDQLELQAFKEAQV